MFNFFKKAAEPSTPAMPDTTTLDTRHGPVTMKRLELQNGEVAYICHKEKRTEDALLHAGRIDYESIDQNTSEDIDFNLIMSEEAPEGGKSDYIYAAEKACNKRLSMEKAVIVVFFDHLKSRGSFKDQTANDVIADIRGHFPARSAGRDTLDRPATLPKPVSGAAADKRKAETPPNFHYSC